MDHVFVFVGVSHGMVRLELSVGDEWDTTTLLMVGFDIIFSFDLFVLQFSSLVILFLFVLINFFLFYPQSNLINCCLDFVFILFIDFDKLENCYSMYGTTFRYS